MIFVGCVCQRTMKGNMNTDRVSPKGLIIVQIKGALANAPYSILICVLDANIHRSEDWGNEVKIIYENTDIYL